MHVPKEKIEYEIGLTIRELEVIQLRINALSSAIPPKEMQLTAHLMEMLVQQLNELKFIIERNKPP